MVVFIKKANKIKQKHKTKAFDSQEKIIQIEFFFSKFTKFKFGSH